MQVGDDEAEWGTLGWEAAGVTVAEEDGHVELAMVLSKPYAYALQVRPASRGSTATDGEDYLGGTVLPTVTIQALSQRATLRVAILDDDEPEDAEDFTLLLSLNFLPVQHGTLDTTVTIARSDKCVERTGQEETDLWCVDWFATTVAEGESVTLAVRNPDGTVAGSDEIAVTLHIGRTESTADVDDIIVRDHAQPGEALRAHPFSPNKHHLGGWAFIHGFFPVEEARLRTMTVEALDNLDGADSETLATWVYVNGWLAGVQELTITNGAQTQQ